LTRLPSLPFVASLNTNQSFHLNATLLQAKVNRRFHIKFCHLRGGSFS
jgi:hypothetical protein